MKKIYLLLTISLSFIAFGCNVENGPNTDTIPNGNRTIQSIYFEGCEYIYIRRYGSIGITHKGNCMFCDGKIKH